MIKKYQPKYKQCLSNSLEKNNNFKKTIKPIEYNPIAKTNYTPKNKIYSQLSKPKSITIADIDLKKRSKGMIIYHYIAIS